MGYYMSVMETGFTMSAMNKAGALAAIKKLCEHEKEIGSGGSGSGDVRTKHFAWVNSSDVERADSLSDALRAWGWITEEDNFGDVFDIYLDDGHTKIGDEEYLWDAIAPYVDNGSYIQMQGDDGAIWRWSFKDGKCHDIGGRVMFDE